VLFSEIAPETVTPDELEKAFRCKDSLSRAETILEWADKLNCRKFVSASDIAEVFTLHHTHSLTHSLALSLSLSLSHSLSFSLNDTHLYTATNH
jgi:hypothetical protein